MKASGNYYFLSSLVLLLLIFLLIFCEVIVVYDFVKYLRLPTVAEAVFGVVIFLMVRGVFVSFMMTGYSFFSGD